MKNLLLAFILLLSLQCFAQLNRQTVSIPVKCATCTTPQTLTGYVYLPNDFNTSNKKYPVLFFNNGTLNNTTLNDLNGQALPALLNSGMSLNNIINPKDGKPYSFVTVALINNPDYAYHYELSWLKQTYGDRFDTSRVYASGLSQGTMMVMLAIMDNDTIARHLRAVVPMSMPDVAGTWNWSLFKTYQPGIWFFAGNADAFTPKGTLRYDSIAKIYDPNTYLTIYNGGHSGWNTYYDVKYVDPVLKMNIYQWMLQYERSLAILPVKFISVKLRRKTK